MASPFLPASVFQAQQYAYSHILRISPDLSSISEEGCRPTADWNIDIAWYERFQHDHGVHSILIRIRAIFCYNLESLALQSYYWLFVLRHKIHLWCNFYCGLRVLYCLIIKLTVIKCYEDRKSKINVDWWLLNGKSVFVE